MFVSKNLNIGMLLDFYGQLLTDKQSAAVDSYYNQDFSLAEIAEQMQISRQGARDLIKRGEKQLLDLEEALGLVTRFSNILSDLKGIKNSCDKIREISDDNDIIKNIDNIDNLIKNISDKI